VCDLESSTRRQLRLIKGCKCRIEEEERKFLACYGTRKLFPFWQQKATKLDPYAFLI
jgi:hypothetical protein